MASIADASGAADLHDIRTLFRAYAAAIGFDLAYQGFEAELAGLPGRYAAPGGTLLLARDGAGAPLGCAGIRPHGTAGACELKRLYVVPAARGSGLARALMDAALAFARRAGYRRMHLDTLPKMEAAIGLYRTLGFAPVPTPTDDAGLGQIYFSRALDREGRTALAGPGPGSHIRGRGGAGRGVHPDARRPTSDRERMALPTTLRLGVNIDHVATLRNARGEAYPDPVRAAHLAVEAGADGITAHLREDRRHIRDADMAALKRTLAAPLNFEMAATDEMVAIALATEPHAACLVPEKREERTTEGGLDIVTGRAHLAPRIRALSGAGIRVSLFVEPEPAVMEAARALEAPVVELHTGSYCEAVVAGDAPRVAHEFDRIRRAAEHGAGLGLEIHAGHGLTVASVGPVAALPQIAELNIGHALIADAVFCGLAQAVRDMRAAMDRARAA